MFERCEMEMFLVKNFCLKISKMVGRCQNGKENEKVYTNYEGLSTFLKVCER